MAKIKAPAACPRILISRGWFSPGIVVVNSGGASNLPVRRALRAAGEETVSPSRSLSHTVLRSMRKNRAKLNQVSRNAATALFFYAGFILAVCFLVARFTAWGQAEPVAKEPFYLTLPGVNVDSLPPPKADAVLKKLNVERCHCGCMRSVASCRNHHSSCTESIVAARDEVDAAGRR